MAWAALLVVYVMWGSTFLAIRVGVRTMPPLTFSAVRFVVAGAVLLPLGLRTGTDEERARDRPGARQWMACAVVGTLLVTMGNGGVSLAEQHLESGLAAVLAATIPLWVVLLSAGFARRRPRLLELASVVLGFVGVAVLVAGGGAGGQISSVVIVLIGSLGWAIGTVLAGRLPLPRRTLLASSMQMLVGGAVLAVIGAVRGEYGDVHLSDATAQTWFAFVWLVLGGSMLAFSAYGYALAHLPLSTVATYAYVNPIVAAILGATILSEHIAAREIIGSVLIVASVAITIRSPARNAEPAPVPVDPAEAAVEAERCGGALPPGQARSAATRRTSLSSSSSSQRCNDSGTLPSRHNRS